MTRFVYGATTLTMEQDPLAPRKYTEEQVCVYSYDSTGAAYAYDRGTATYLTESIVFPAISWANVLSTLAFIDNTVDGSYNLFTWYDRDAQIQRLARYKGLQYIKVSPTYFQLTLTLEVLT